MTSKPVGHTMQTRGAWARDGGNLGAATTAAPSKQTRQHVKAPVETRLFDEMRTEA